MSGVEIPLLFASAAAAASVAGGVVGYQGARYKAAIADQNADAAKREGAAIAAIERSKGRKDAAAARARAGASGAGVTGSALSVIGELASAGEFRARQAIYHGRRRVQQFNADKVAAKQEGTASLLSGVVEGGTLLTRGLQSRPQPVEGDA